MFDIVKTDTVREFSARTTLPVVIARLRRKLKKMPAMLNRTLGQQRQHFFAWMAFSHELRRSPREMGAICPSSPCLARQMARCLAFEENGLVVELGAGTGSVTRALIDHGIEPGRLIVIERSSVLAEGLRKRFPHIEVIHGDAMQLRKLLGARALKVGAIFSSLPLRSLPHHDANAIREEIHAVMHHGSRLIQYTYNLHKPSIPETPSLVRIATYRVWANLPPARVDMYSFVEGNGKTSPDGFVSTV